MFRFEKAIELLFIVPRNNSVPEAELAVPSALRLSAQLPGSAVPRFMTRNLTKSRIEPPAGVIKEVISTNAGVPLAFAFIATIGQAGLLTLWIKDLFNVNIYDKSVGFTLYSFWGLSLVYMYFQFPLMVLIMAPALDGLKREWREASENLGASSFQYWQYIAMPILLPSILGTMILLFGNAFGAYATAYALTGGSLNLITIQIGAQMRGDVLHNPNLGYALAFGMVMIMAISLAGYSWLQRQTERWLR